MKYEVYWFCGQNIALNWFTFHSDTLVLSSLHFDLKLLYCISLFPLSPVFMWTLDR